MSNLATVGGENDPLRANHYVVDVPIGQTDGKPEGVNPAVPVGSSQCFFPLPLVA